MKIKCIKVINASGEEVESSSWITLGKIYYVMGIYIYNQKMSYQILNDNWERDKKKNIKDFEAYRTTMGHIPANGFEIVSDIIPSNWNIKILKMSAISIAPGAWQESYFYDRLSDAEPEAQKIFERERDLILKEDP